MSTHTPRTPLTYDAALPRVIKVLKKKCEVSEVLPTDRLLEDLEMDCLEATEVFMAIEEEFDITLPSETTPFFAAEETWVVGHLAALVIQCQDLEVKRHPAFAKSTIPAHERVSFTQLGGVLETFPDSLYLSCGTNRITYWGTANGRDGAG
jgi:acyl carrier protein